MSESKGPLQDMLNSRAVVVGVAVAVFVCVALIGYLVVDTVFMLRRQASETMGLPSAFATQVSSQINPTPTITVDPVTVIRAVERLARLETSSYTIEKVITAESGEGPFGFLFSDRLLLVARGEVIAGLDLERISEDDIQIVGDSIYITLPAAEIFVATLDSEGTYVYDRETALFGQQIDLETLARQEAERAILEAALEGGILDEAERNGESYITGLLDALGFEDIVYLGGTPAPDQNRGEP